MLNRLHLAQAGLCFREGGVPDTRTLIGWVSTLRAGPIPVTGLILDATQAGQRPRELDRSARRDLAATLRRAGLHSGGIDLFIPAEHYASPAHADRAMAAMVAAIDLARELATLTEAPEAIVCTEFPPAVDSGGGADARPGELLGTLLGSIREHAQIADVRLADTAPGAARPEILRAVDVARCVLAGKDPAAELTARSVLRLSDAAAGQRVPLGRGQAETRAIAGAWAVLGGSRAPILDLRGLIDAKGAVADAVSAWGLAVAM